MYFIKFSLNLQIMMEFILSTWSKNDMNLQSLSISLFSLFKLS